MAVQIWRRGYTTNVLYGFKQLTPGDLIMHHLPCVIPFQYNCFDIKLMLKR